MARSDVLVTADWAESNLDAPRTVFVEVDIISFIHNSFVIIIDNWHGWNSLVGWTTLGDNFFSIDNIVNVLRQQSIIGILASMLLPALAKAKAKANRIKCVNNLGSIGKATTGFADANAQRTPWQLTPLGAINHKLRGATGGNNNNDVRYSSGIVSVALMRNELQTPKILASPCNPTRQAGSETLQAAVWKSAARSVIEGGLSYSFAQGGDVQRPATILALTKNIDTNNNQETGTTSLANATWRGSDEATITSKGTNANPNVAFAGLNKSQGQLVLGDGSAKQSSNADLGSAGKVVKAHRAARGGQSKTDSSWAVFRR